MNPRIVEVRQNILRKNDVLARAFRERCTEAGVFVVSLVSSPGAGKTALLERTLSALHPVRRVAVVVGDLATECDAERLRKSGAPVRQITTGTLCHLDAQMVETAVLDWVSQRWTCCSSRMSGISSAPPATTSASTRERF
jgi:hydrogenase nickel incorporation protein HypB